MAELTPHKAPTPETALENWVDFQHGVMEQPGEAARDVAKEPAPKVRPNIARHIEQQRELGRRDLNRMTTPRDAATLRGVAMAAMPEPLPPPQPLARRLEQPTTFGQATRDARPDVAPADRAMPGQRAAELPQEVQRWAQEIINALKSINDKLDKIGVWG